ncbi:MAG: hypothetical protein K2L48_00755 [Mycoplasmoidaceae bacterium]|nr:hypothetical protein [Mycoplasmoidaceae bacterium]
MLLTPEEDNIIDNPLAIAIIKATPIKSLAPVKTFCKKFSSLVQVIIPIINADVKNKKDISISDHWPMPLSPAQINGKLFFNQSLNQTNPVKSVKPSQSITIKIINKKVKPKIHNIAFLLLVKGYCSLFPILKCL